MNEKLSENYSHHKNNKIPWQFFVLLSKKDGDRIHPTVTANHKKKLIYLS